MSKRIAAAVLWFYAGWYLGGYITLYLGVPDLIGPILGVSAAMLFAGDPRRVIWSRGKGVTSFAETAPENMPDRLADAA